MICRDGVIEIPSEMLNDWKRLLDSVSRSTGIASVLVTRNTHPSQKTEFVVQDAWFADQKTSQCKTACHDNISGTTLGDSGTVATKTETYCLVSGGQSELNPYRPGDWLIFGATDAPHKEIDTSNREDGDNSEAETHGDSRDVFHIDSDNYFSQLLILSDGQLFGTICLINISKYDITDHAKKSLNVARQQVEKDLARLLEFHEVRHRGSNAGRLCSSDIGVATMPSCSNVVGLHQCDENKNVPTNDNMKTHAPKTRQEKKTYRGKILVVDDEPIIRSVVRLVLSDKGYQVMEAENGIDALQIYRQNATQIDAVILDVIMPKMGGLETLHQLRLINPNVKILIASGFNNESQEIGWEKLEVSGILTKPYRHERLLNMVEEIVTPPKP